MDGDDVGYLERLFDSANASDVERFVDPICKERIVEDDLPEVSQSTSGLGRETYVEAKDLGAKGDSRSDSSQTNDRPCSTFAPLYELSFSCDGSV